MQCCLAMFIVDLYLMMCVACCHCTHACIQTHVCLRACITFDHTFSSVRSINVCIYMHIYIHTYTYIPRNIYIPINTNLKLYFRIYIYIFVVGVLFSHIQASSTGLLLGCTISKQYAPEAALIRFLKSETYANCFLSPTSM